MLGWPKPGDETTLRVTVISTLFTKDAIKVRYKDVITECEFTLSYKQQPWQELIDQVDELNTGELIG